MKKVAIVSILFAVAMGFNSHAVMAQGSLDDEALEMAFSGDADMQLMLLSEREMEQTQGEFWPWLIRGGLGAIGGAFSYGGQYLATGEGSWSGFGRSVAGGAASGLLGPSRWLSTTLGAAGGSFTTNCCSASWFNF